MRFLVQIDFLSMKKVTIHLFFQDFNDILIRKLQLGPSLLSKSFLLHKIRSANKYR